MWLESPKIPSLIQTAETIRILAYKAIGIFDQEFNTGLPIGIIEKYYSNICRVNLNIYKFYKGRIRLY